MARPVRTTASPQRPYLSVVIPAYNEASRLGQSLRTVSRYFETQPYAVELLVVDDGSQDDTFGLIQKLASKLAVPVRALRYVPNRGKGYALKVGFAHATGERILFSDADLSTPIEETAALLEALAAGCDVAIGSRKLPTARVRVRQPWYRERMGKAFTWIVSRFLTEVSDVTCGFKLYRAEVGQELFGLLRIYGWAFDAELLFLADRKGLWVQEIPVEWVDQSGTKVRLFRDAWSSFWGLVRIRRNDSRGLYAAAHAIRGDVETWGPLDYGIGEPPGEALRP